MKLNKFKLIVFLIVLLFTCFAVRNLENVKAHTLKYQIILINKQKQDFSLISGKIDIEKHVFRLEYVPYTAEKTKTQFVCIAETVNDFGDVKVIGSFQIFSNVGPKQYGMVTYTNPKLVRGKRYIVWASIKPISNLTSTEKKSLLERAEAILSEQERIGNVGAYKDNGIDEMINESTFNLSE